MFPHLFTETINTSRIVDGDDNKLVYEANLSGLACAIQQADAKISMDLVGSYGKDWLVFCDIVDVLEGDRAEWNGKTYRVMAVDRLDFEGDSHMELLIRIFES